MHIVWIHGKIYAIDELFIDNITIKSCLNRRWVKIDDETRIILIAMVEEKKHVASPEDTTNTQSQWKSYLGIPFFGCSSNNNNNNSNCLAVTLAYFARKKGGQFTHTHIKGTLYAMWHKPISHSLCLCHSCHNGSSPLSLRSPCVWLGGSVTFYPLYHPWCYCVCVFCCE